MIKSISISFPILHATSLGFYEIIKENIMKFVRESHLSKKVTRYLNSTFIVLITKKKNSMSFNDYHEI
jgi:hypothetical protein